MRLQVNGLATVLVVVVSFPALCCGGGESSGGSASTPTSPTTTTPPPTGTTPPSTQSCRTYPTGFTVRHTGTANPSFTGTTGATCSFSTATLQFSCTINYADSTGFTSTTNSLATYATLADVVAEVSVVPPLTRVRSVSGTTTTSLTPPNTSMTTYTYDAQNRLMRESGIMSTTYTAWDGAGRPTAATSVAANGSQTTLAISSNDSARSRTTSNTQAGVTTSCTEQFDANGIQIATECTSTISAAKTNTVTTITGTAQVCR